MEEEKIQNLMSTPSTAFVASIPSVTLSGTMQAVALRAEQLVKNHPEGAPFRGFCLLNLVPFLPQSLARQSLGKSTPPQKDDIALTDVMPCAYLCGMSLSEASVLAEIYTSSRFRTSPALFHVCEVPCVSHPTQKRDIFHVYVSSLAGNNTLTMNGVAHIFWGGTSPFHNSSRQLLHCSVSRWNGTCSRIACESGSCGKCCHTSWCW